MSKASIKKLLTTYSKEELVDIVLQMYTASNEAKNWLEFFAKPDIKSVLESYKEKIESQFYTRSASPKYPKFRDCNALISAFKKMYPDPEALADLMLFYVETAVELPRNYGDFGEQYINAIENNFKKAIAHIAEYRLTDQFNNRILKLIKDSDACGYWLGGILEDIYNHYTEAK